MIGYLIFAGILAAFAWPVIALGNVYDAAKAAERMGVDTSRSAVVVMSAPVRTRSMTPTEAATARQQWTDLVAAQHHDRRRIRRVGVAVLVVALSALAFAESMVWLGNPQTWWHWTVSGLIAVACLAAPLTWRLRRG